MAQKKINPTAFRLSIKQTWWSITTSSNIHEDIFIRKLIKGTFKSFNILTSEIGIKRKGNLIFIDLLVYPYTSAYSKKTNFISNPHFPHLKLDNLVTEHNAALEKIKNNPKISYKGIWSLLKRSTLLKKTNYLNGYFNFRYRYVTSILELILNKKFEGSNVIAISIRKAPSIASNAQILCDWINLEIRKNPQRHKTVLNWARNMYTDYQKDSLIDTKHCSQDTNLFCSFKNQLKNNDRLIN